MYPHHDRNPARPRIPIPFHTPLSSPRVPRCSPCRRRCPTVRRTHSCSASHSVTAAGVPHQTAEGDADFHALRHTFTTMLGRSAPLKVVQDLARHSTPLLTVGRYSHADAAEKAAAVAGIPLGGADAELLRAHLEAIAATLFALFASLFAPTSHPLENTE